MSQLIRPWSLIQQSQIGHGTILVADGAVGVLPNPFTEDDLLASIDGALPQSLTR